MRMNVELSFVLLIAFLFAGTLSSINAAEINSPAKQVFVTDFGSGKVLLSKNADQPMKPASMAKIMTVFVAFQRIADGSLKMNDEFVVSKKAWKKTVRSFFHLKCHLFKYFPKTLWLCNQLYNSGDDLLKAHAASMAKIVVGIPGVIIPM